MAIARDLVVGAYAVIHYTDPRFAKDPIRAKRAAGWLQDKPDLCRLEVKNADHKEMASIGFACRVTEAVV